MEAEPDTDNRTPEQRLSQWAVCLSLSPLCVYFKINFLSWVPYLLESLMPESYFGWIIIIMIITCNIYKTLYSLCSRFTCVISFWILISNLWARQERYCYQQNHPLEKIFSIKEEIIIFACEKNNVTLILNVTPILKIAPGFSVKSLEWMVEDKKHNSAWINHEIYLTIKFSINVEIFALNLGSWGFKSRPNIKNMFYFIAQSTWQIYFWETENCQFWNFWMWIRLIDWLCWESWICYDA